MAASFTTAEHAGDGGGGGEPEDPAVEGGGQTDAK